MIIHTMTEFDRHTLETFNQLKDMFKDAQNLQKGQNFRFCFKAFQGTVYVHCYQKNDGQVDVFDVQWFGQPEAFGFRVSSQSEEVYGPYHFH